MNRRSHEVTLEELLTLASGDESTHRRGLNRVRKALQEQFPNLRTVADLQKEVWISSFDGVASLSILIGHYKNSQLLTNVGLISFRALNTQLVRFGFGPIPIIQDIHDSQSNVIARRDWTWP